jgi:hypothetical protein
LKNRRCKSFKNHLLFFLSTITLLKDLGVISVRCNLQRL